MRCNLSGKGLTKIPDDLDPNITELYLNNNKITKIENLPASLHGLYLHYNNITKIENLPSSLHTLHLDNNKITKIENLPASLHALYLNSNQITEIPLQILELRHLTEFSYNDIEIKHIPRLIQRWLDRLNNRITNNNLVYGDNQNIHNHHIQNSFRNSLANLIKDKHNMSIEIVKIEILDNNILLEETKREILNYCDDKEIHSIYQLTYADLLTYIWPRIINHVNRDDILDILNSEIKDGICMCFTGRLTRLLNTLVGYYPDIEIQISNSEQITNIITVLRKRYEGDQLKEKVKEELMERQYSVDVIEEWTGYLE